MTTADDETEGEAGPRAVGGRLRAARRAAGLTQDQVAEQLGVYRRAVHSWEKGESFPSQLPALADLYGVSPTYIVWGIEPSSVELAALRTEVAALTAGLEQLTTDVRAMRGLTHATLREILSILLRLADEAGTEPEA